MLVSVRLQYTEAVIRDAALASWHRAFGLRFVVALLLVATSLAYLVWHGDRSWFVGVMGTLLILCATFAVGFYLVSLRSSLRKFRKMHSPEASLQGDASGFSVSSELGAFTLPWSAVRQVRRYPDFWLLVLSRTSQVTIPLAGVAPDAQSFLLQKIEGAGGSVNG